MTKVRMSVNLLDYQQDMKETLRQVVQDHYVEGGRSGWTYGSRVFSSRTCCRRPRSS